MKCEECSITNATGAMRDAGKQDEPRQSIRLGLTARQSVKVCGCSVAAPLLSAAAAGL